MDIPLPSALATARNGIWSMGVLLLTGPLCVRLGLFHTTRFTPDFFTTLGIQANSTRLPFLQTSEYKTGEQTLVLFISSGTLHCIEYIKHVSWGGYRAVGCAEKTCTRVRALQHLTKRKMLSTKSMKSIFYIMES